MDSMNTSYSNKRSKTLTPLKPEVEEEMDCNNDFDSLPTKNAEGGMQQYDHLRNA